MYTIFQLTKKYIRHYLKSSNAKGHGVHSPFVFDFIINVLQDKTAYGCYEKVEVLRKQLLKTNQVIDVEDFGAGSTVIKSNKRGVKDIAKSSLKSTKYAQLLHRIVKRYQPKTIIELGTSLGITTSYLAFGNSNACVHTCEGAATIASIAKQNIALLGLKNVSLTEGDFNQTLAPLLFTITTVDLAFVDGNHRKKPTLQYFEQLLEKANHQTIFIFDDIHWSEEMEAAWSEIQSHPLVTLTIDLFFIGIVCINKDFKVKQHFSIAY